MDSSSSSSSAHSSHDEAEDEDDDTDESESDESENEDGAIGDDSDDNDNHVEWKDIIGDGRVIALRTPKKVKESFYLCYANKVCIAKDKKFDSYGHFILKGMEYIECNYLTIQSEKNKKFVQYKKLSADVYVIPEEVLTPFVDISADFKLKLDERQFLDDWA